MRILLRTWMIIGALVIASCGGSAGSDEEASPANDVASGPASFDDLDLASPLADFLGFDMNGEDIGVELSQLQANAEQMIAECMRESGFEYTPLPAELTPRFESTAGDPPLFGADWTAQYGFGVSTRRFAQSLTGDLVGHPGTPPGDVPSEDPNQDYVNALGAAERDAYFEALLGPPPDLSEDSGPPMPGGCTGPALQTAFEEGVGMTSFLDAFGDEVRSLQRRAEADPQVVEFKDDVSNCVAEAGLRWVDMATFEREFGARLDLVRPVGVASGQPLDEAALELLGELQREEFELAPIVVSCGGGPLRELEIVNRVRADLEQGFLEANAAALEALNPGG